MRIMEVRKKRIDDRISDLPEELILHILSFLSREDQIKTGVLSRRWQFLWTRSPDLYFNWDNYEKRNYENRYEWHDPEYAQWTTRALVLCKCPKLNSFRVIIGYRYSSDVRLWIEFAANREVERFELDFPSQPFSFVILPTIVYRNSSVRELRFSGCNLILALITTVSWSSLKKLTISGGDITNEALQKILAGAPVLEILDLFIVNLPPRGLHLRFPRLATDVKFPHVKTGPLDLEISAPNVHSLEVKGEFRSCKLVNMTSLVKATVLGSHKEPAEEVCINGLLLVRTLTIGPSLIKGIAKLRANGAHPKFSKCKCLTINIDKYILETKPSAIASMLKSARGIETLIVTMSSNIEDGSLEQSSSQDGHIERYWTSRKRASRYLRYLKIVKFDGFWAYRNLAFSFVQFLLKNASALQKMIINLEREGYPKRVVPEEQLETSKKLLSFERSSPHAQLLVY